MKTFQEIREGYSRGAGSGSGVIQSADPKNKALQALMKKHNVTGKPINKSGKGLKLIGKPDDIKKVLDAYIKLQEVEEDAPANSVAGGGVDLTPGIKRTDNRHKYSIGKMFRRNNGVK